MDLIDKLKDLSTRIREQKDNIETEEGTKNAFVLPFLSILGYDVFNPNEVSAEFHADVGTKKGEKVDYAIMINGKPVILMECKKATTNLDDTLNNQLFRYYSATEAKIAILTNGIQYRFYADLDETNKMDKKHFFEFNMLQFDDLAYNEIKKLSKSVFDLDEMLGSATALKYTNEMKSKLKEELASPSNDFLKIFVRSVFDGNITQNKLEEFLPLFKKAVSQFINERIDSRLKSAMASDESELYYNDEYVDEDLVPKIETTSDENDGYYIVKNIVRKIVDVNRIAMRDTQSYCGVLLDDNNRKPICRLRFNHSKYYIGLFDNEKKEEEKISIETLDDIYKYESELLNTVERYEKTGSE